MYLNYKILNKKFQQEYSFLFYQYFLKIAYGNDVIAAESLIGEEDE